jgi:hypothetical protein
MREIFRATELRVTARLPGALRPFDEGRVQIAGMTLDPGPLGSHEHRHALTDEAPVGRNAPIGEALDARSRGLHALCHDPREPDAGLSR